MIRGMNLPLMRIYSLFSFKEYPYLKHCHRNTLENAPSYISINSYTSQAVPELVEMLRTQISQRDYPQ